MSVEVPPQLDFASNEQLGYWMPRSIMEVRNRNGDPYNTATMVYVLEYSDMYGKREQLLLKSLSIFTRTLSLLIFEVLSTLF